MRAVGLAGLITALTLGSARADDLVQPPQLSAPQRGSVSGELGGLHLGPGEVERGSFSLPFPLELPADRGPLLASPWPHYASDAGLGEYGMGWSPALEIRRSRVLGDLDWASDDLTGPWGRMVRGSSGVYRPLDLRAAVRVEVAGDQLTAYTPDGARWLFGGTETLATARGNYAWYLVEVDSIDGRKTLFHYAHNASGRRFLDRVSWGGFGDLTQYELDLFYEPLPQVFVSYLSGQEVTLDRRVKSVQLKVANGAALEERWHATFTYLQDTTGPAYYLTRIDRVFGSGDAAPPITYSYRLAADRLPTLALQRNLALDTVVKTFGSAVLGSAGATPFDVDGDGRPDLEERVGYTTIRRTDSGFVYEPLATSPHPIAACRHSPSPTNRARALAQLKAGDTGWEVVSLQPSATHAGTTLDVCTRAGDGLFETALHGDWSLSATTRLTDVNRDHQPDLVQVGAGLYTILPNTSSDAGYSFGAPVQGLLQPAFVPSAAWVRDMNGDGIPDLVARSSTLVTVWFGLGDFQFASEGQTLAVRTHTGAPVTSLDRFDVTFLDANKDGLTDLLLGDGSLFTLYLNDGLELTEVPVPALAGLNATYTRPQVLDASGSGNVELTTVRSGQAWYLDLDDPGTGLLASADDGKGNHVLFDYQRAPATPGGEQRHAVLARMTTQSVGTPDVTQQFTYAAPQLHSRARFLLGFGQVTRSDGRVAENASFLHDDDLPGVMTGGTTTDTLAAGVRRFVARDFTSVITDGVAWLRPAVERDGLERSDGLAHTERRVDYLAWESDVCPAQVKETNAWGTVTTTTTRASVAALDHAMHCLPERVTRAGAHANPQLDFVDQVHVTRDAIGQPTSIENVAPDGSVLVEQTLVYDPDHQLVQVSSPGRGASSFAWDPTTRLLMQVSNPDGVTVRAERAPVSDLTVALTTDRGAGRYTEYFAFDGQERLSRAWNDLGGTSAAVPAVSYDYRYAAAPLPSWVRTRTLVDASSGSTRESVELAGAAGANLAVLNAVPGGWAFDGLAAHDPAHGIVQRWVRAATTADPATLEASSLYGGANLIAETQTSSFGAAAARTWFHAGVVRQTANALDVANGLFVDTQTENGAFTHTRRLDAAGRLASQTDEAGSSYGYLHDALGRLRVLQLPDGNTARVSYDGHARVHRIERDGIGAVEIGFDPTTGIMTGERFTDAAGALVRSVAYTVDAIGRRTEERHTDAAGDCRTLRLFHDGATPSQPTQVTMRGFLSGVSGDGWAKTMVHRSDGKLLERMVVLGGWRSVDTTFTWGEDGTPTGHTTTVYGLNGPLASRTERSHFDSWGRLASVDSNGQPLLTIGYDGDDRVASITLADGSQTAFSYDSYTEMLTGLTQAGDGFSSVDGFRRNTRGLLEEETLGLGAAAVTRDYTYSAQRFLTASTDTQASFGYAYDGAGLPSSVTDASGTRTLSRSGRSIDAGAMHYAYDAFGRAIQRDDLALRYGPDGHLAVATRGNDVFGFAYDEQGNRLLKTKNGAPVAAYLDEGYLDDSGLTEPLLAAGRLIGVLQGGVPRLLPVDHRGTLLGEPDGTSELPSPYGDRAVHPSLAAALDYVRHGWDADLGTVRMGVRDYDPRLGQFLTPDPYVFANPDTCTDHPVECNLYSYAANDPLSFHDPDGRIANWIIGGVGGFVGGFVVGVGYEAGRSIFGHHEFKWKEAGKRGLAWGVTAATVGATGGLSLYYQAGGAVAGSIAGGVLHRKLTGQSTTAGNVVIDGVFGLAGWGLGKFVIGPAAQAAFTKLRGLVNTSFQAWRNVNPNILSGHGSLQVPGVNGASPITVVPPGTTVTVWTEHGATITDALGNAIETSRPIGFTGVGAPTLGTPGIVGARTYLPGSIMPNYTLHPPTGLNIMGNPTTVFWSTKLSTLLKPNMGNVNWAACLGVIVK